MKKTCYLILCSTILTTLLLLTIGKDAITFIVIELAILLIVLFYHSQKNKVKVTNATTRASSFDNLIDENTPFDNIIIDIDYNIKSKNFDSIYNISKGANLSNILSNSQIDDILNNVKPITIKIKNNEYVIYKKLGEIVESSNVSFFYILYFINQSKILDNESDNSNYQTVMMNIAIDNLKEVKDTLEESDRVIFEHELKTNIRNWAKDIGGYIDEMNNDIFYLVLDSDIADTVISKKFTILHSIKDNLKIKSHIMPTISIGMAYREGNFAKLKSDVKSSLELAQGRGGNQAVVLKNSRFEYYGAESTSNIVRSNIKSRVFSQALVNLISNSEKVFIMGHKGADLDSFGAAIGVDFLASLHCQKVYTILDYNSSSIIKAKQLLVDKDYINIITSKDALDKFNPSKDTLIVVDTHRKNFAECPELVELAENIVVIDHHRRSQDIIPDTTLLYLEPYSSSTSELVTEILQASVSVYKMDATVATLLLAGITVDTKNFNFQVGVRTFEAASNLKRFGANNNDVKGIFKSTLSDYIAKARTIINTTLEFEGIGISICDDELNPRLICPTAADGILDIDGIKASFVLGMSDEAVIISGRSLGDINVHAILEKLGGGGDFTIAGAQIKNASVSDAKKQLIEAISDYLQEKEND